MMTIYTLQRRIDRTAQTLEEERSARVGDLQKALSIITQDVDYSQLLFKAVGIPLSSSESMMSSMSCDILIKVSTGNLEVLVGVRVQEDLHKI